MSNSLHEYSHLSIHRKNLYEALAKARAAREQSPIHFYKPNPGCQELFHQSLAQTRILMGGNSSGKSYAAIGAEVAYHVVEERDVEGNRTGFAVHPYRKVKVPNVGWISSTTEEVQREPEGGTQSYVEKFLSSEIIDKKEKSGAWIYIKTRSGCRIVFKTMMSGSSAYHSASVNWIAFDEPHFQTVVNESRMRLIRSKPAGSMWWAFTPVVDPEKKVSLEMVRWVVDDIVRPTMVKQKRGVKSMDTEVWHMHTQENADYIDYHAALKATEGMGDEERHVRLTGEYIEVRLGVGFDHAMLNFLKNESIAPMAEGDLEVGPHGVRFKGSFHYSEKFREGYVFRFWHLPVSGRTYVIGVDVGGTSDPTSVTVVDPYRNEIVAEFHGWVNEIDLAVHLQRVGWYYNNAEIAVEVNSVGKTTVALMGQGHPDFGILPYDNLYRRPVPSKLQRGYDVASWSLGWLTTSGSSGTRDLIISNVRMFFAECMRRVKSDNAEEMTGCLSVDHLLEAEHFVENNRGKLEAAHGFFDDRIISLGIALQVSKRYQETQEFDYEKFSRPKDGLGIKDGKMVIYFDNEDSPGSVASARTGRGLYHIP